MAVLVNGATKGYSETFHKYKCAYNDVDFYWGYDGKPKDSLIISLDSVILIEIVQASIQVVVEYLNKYCSFSRP